MPYATARPLDTDQIPVIDLQPLRDGSNVQQVAKALHQASQNLGFIYVKGHGIPQAAIDQARQAAYQFFGSPETQKATLSVTEKHRGWLKPGASKMHDDAKPDLKESFIWGHQDRHGYTEEDHPLRGRNQWPAWLPELEQAAMHYFHHAHQVAFELLQGFAIGLDLPPTYFLKTADKPLSRASFVYYPAQADSCGIDRFGVAPHTDFGMLTVLCQDAVGGLQVETIHGEWIEAPPVPGSLVVNVGDLLSLWTQGAYKSTPHRVVNSSGKERLSLVLAFDPNPETLIESETFGAQAPHNPNVPTTCGDYLLKRFAKAFSYRNKTH